MQFIKNNILWIIGGIIGAVAGYFYWQQVGCMSGTCSITSSPINSTLYGAISGSLFLNLFKNNKLNTK